MCPAWNHFVFIVKKHSRTKSSCIIIKKPSISIAPNAQKSLHPLILWFNTHVAVIMLTLREFQTLIQAKTILDWRFLACKEYQDCKCKTGSQRAWPDIGEELSRENSWKKRENNNWEKSKRRNNDRRTMNKLKGKIKEWFKKIKSFRIKILISLSSSTSLKTDNFHNDSYFQETFFLVVFGWI